MSLADDIRDAVEEGAHQGLLEAARRVHDQAAANIGVGDPSEDPNPALALKEQGHIRVDPGAGDTVVVSFDAPYAAKQHEAQHFEHPRGGGAKYLERALTEVIPQLEGILAAEVRKRLAGQSRR